MSKYFWFAKVNGDTKAHAARKVGPATDYDVPRGTVLHAPFAGRVYPFYTEEGGKSLRLIGAKYELVVQHLDRNDLYRSGVWRPWRGKIALSGNTGTATDGPHVHAYIRLRNKGNKRVSMTEWLRDYVHKGKPRSMPKATRTFLGIR